ncbi:hypothetical protein HELRODRAFT_159291 [Helobdella robusta]|uniref:Cadherin domain-containing protein n=1 Tax=Helobdella robusta TaxID=6412 RepID=T1ENU5_HELRO|nr:hypothetical protein HELRODRAFT_159291 [Helobdella robusta]ESO12705.1 hypothetical protein HELRODRAFT_159291 [Helobdella robusta]
MVTLQKIIIVVAQTFLLDQRQRSASAARDSNTIKYDLYEELPFNTTVGRLAEDANITSMYDKHTLGRLNYYFLRADSVVAKFFRVDNKTGVLSTSDVRLDRDCAELCRRKETCMLSLDVVVQPVEYFQIIKVRVELLDLNDNAPTFRESHILLSINEASPIGSSYLLPAAVDDDSPKYGIQRYEIESGTEKLGLVFSTSPSLQLEAKLVLRSVLDRELEARYQVVLRAIDGGTHAVEGLSSLTGSIVIDIIVADHNDNKPVFDQSKYDITVSEDTPVNSVVLKVSATDADDGLNGQIEYLLVGDSSHHQPHDMLISVNNHTGQVVLTAKLDREKTSIYQLRVLARDRGSDPLTSEVELIIRVADANDNKPSISVTFLQEQYNNNNNNNIHNLNRNFNVNIFNSKLFAFSKKDNKLVSTDLPEDAKTGSFVGHVSVKDPDEGNSGSVDCRLHDSGVNGIPTFLLQNTTFAGEYRIVLSGPLDRELNSVFMLNLSCRDRGQPPLTSEMMLEINVKDINDNPPIFDKPLYKVSLSENNFIGEVVEQVTAKDADEGLNGKIDYALSEHAKGFFQIDERGLISAIVPLDRETNSVFEMDVVARDRGVPSLTSTSHLTIIVDDLNDEKPTFTHSTYSFSIFENEPVGTAIGTVKAIDRDSNQFNEFTYRMYSDHQQSSRYFSVHPNTGVISSRIIFDREQHNLYKFYVTSVDAHLDVLSGSTVVICSILDRNDNYPEFKYPTPTNNTLHVSSYYPIGQPIVKVEAVDKDINANGQIKYRIVSIESNDDSDDEDEMNEELDDEDENALKYFPFQIDTTTGAIKVAKDLTLYNNLFKLNIEATDLGTPPNFRQAELNIRVNSSLPYGSSSKQTKNESLFTLGGAFTLVFVIILTSISFVVIVSILVCLVLCRQHRKNQNQKSKHKTRLSLISVTCDGEYELTRPFSNKDSITMSQNCNSKLNLPYLETTELAATDDNFIVESNIGNVPNVRCSSVKFGKKYLPVEQDPIGLNSEYSPNESQQHQIIPQTNHNKLFVSRKKKEHKNRRALINYVLLVFL